MDTSLVVCFCGVICTGQMCVAPANQSHNTTTELTSSMERSVSPFHFECVTAYSAFAALRFQKKGNCCYKMLEIKSVNNYNILTNTPSL